MSRLKRLISEIHHRSLWQVRTRARHRSLLACVSCLALAFLACGRGDDTAYTRGSTVIISYCCGNEALNPSHDMGAIKLVYLSLAEHDPKGRLMGRLATSWEPSPDYREWTYHLRTDVRWHDGVPVTAHDIAFTIDLMRTFRDLDYGAGAFESVTVHDDSTVTIRSGHGRRLYQTWMVFYPKHLLEHLDPERLAEWDFWTRPVGNGPYRFVRLEPETMMEFEANPDFYMGKPRIERVILKFSLDAGLTELLSGDVDAVPSFPAAGLPTVGGDPRFRVYYHVWGTATRAIYWKNDHPLFRDPRVRRALTLAIDRRELLGLLGLPDDLPVVDGPLTPDQYRRGELPEPLPYDPVRARALLDSAGWRDEDGDGVRERDGRQFRFTALLQTFTSEHSAGQGAVGVHVQSQLRKVGVQMELQLMDVAVLVQRLESGNFEAVFRFLRFYETPWLRLVRLGEGAPIGYQNSRVVELIDRASRTWVPEEEDRIYGELMEIFRADLPVTMLYPGVSFTVAHRRLRGLSTPWRDDPVGHMEELWLEEEP
ncbi:MAG: ABC transporter substrate-binding protein [Acidimicrobiia bacterium]